MSDVSDERDPLEALADDFVARFRNGERPPLSEYTRRYPELAAEIRDLFPALVMLEDIRPAAAGASQASASAEPAGASKTPLPERLGDYRILREIGRGGMGIVYEAEQESLGRHVALKVLPAHALLQPRQLERFQREARSAARLHHTNIVPVFGVGAHEGLHYYVMQFIHGQGLDQVLTVLRRLSGRTSADDSATPSAGLASAAAVADALITGVFATPSAAAAGRPDSSASHAAVGPSSASSSIRLPGQPYQSSAADSRQPYWQSVARIGVQVADALTYAHAQGTLHRDIKPANLLFDTQGVVWVTDFGLAKSAGSDNLTHTGDVVGTLRYMAPERFRGKADARSDVYGLGLTLYELLTLQPAFGASERDKLLLQVMQQEPTRPRKLNPAVPRDLETIVLKAVARDPKHRYQSAADLAADLARFIEDKPIRARPVSETEKLMRWCRRNPSLAALACAFVLTLVLGIAGTTWKWLEAETARATVDEEKQRTALARDRAVEARNDAQRLLAGALFERGNLLAEQSDVSEGLLWMHEALRAAGTAAPELSQAIRIGLAGWLEQAHRLETFESSQTECRWCPTSPDGRRVFFAAAGGVAVADRGKTHPFVRCESISALALSPDGGMLLTGHHDKRTTMLQRWDTATAEPMGAPIRHPGRVRALSFAVDGKSFFSGADDGLVRRFDCATGAPLAAGFRHAQRQVNQLALSPDGTTLAVATGAADHYQEHQQAELYLWDLATGKPLVAPLPHPGAVRSVVFAPDGTVVVTGCYDGTAQRWDAKTGKPLGSPLRHARAVSVVRFAPDGRTLATGSEDGSIRFWNARTGTPLVGTIALPPGEVFDLAFSRDGKRLAAASESSGSQGRLHIFVLARSEVPPPARSIEVRVRAPWRIGDGATWLGRFQVAISPDATLVAGPGTAHRINLFDAATGQPRLVAGGADGPLWNAWPAVDVNVISPNGRLIATSSRDTTAVGEARLWDTVTGKLIGPPLTHQNYVSAIAFSPDSKRVVTGCYDGTVQLWDAANSSPVGAPLRQPLRQPVLSLAYGPDGKTLAVGYAANEGGPNCVIVWDLARREPLLPPVQAPSYYVQFSPDGQRLLASSNPQLQFIDAATGHSPGVVPDETAEINSVVFAPDSAAVLLSLTDGTVVMRQVPTGKHIGAAMRHPYRANFAVFSPGTQAQLILAGYEDGSVRLWDRITQKPLGPPMPLGEPAIAGQFTPDGHAFVVSSNRCRSRRWPVPTEVDDDVDQLALRLQVHTGLTMGEGQTILPLTAAQWQARHAKLEASANAAPITSAAGDIAFHDSRAREAEEEDDRFGADWHLQRLAALVAPQAAAGPPLWQVYARRARIATNHDDFHAAEADYATAVARGAPDHLVGWYRYRIHDCLAAKQAVAARWYADRALARVPDDWRLYAGRAEALGQLGNSTARDDDLTAAAAHGADATFLVATAADFARRGQWPKAATLVQQAAAHPHSLPASVSRDHALVLLKVKDQAGYRALCRRLVAAPTVANRADLANQVAWICALGPGGCDDYAQPLQLAELAVRATGPDRSARASVLNTLGGVLLRAGRYPDAIARLEEAIALSKGPGTPHDLLFLALAHHHLGHAAQARQYLAQVPAPQPNGPFSFDRVELDLLESEARALIK